MTDKPAWLASEAAMVAEFVARMTDGRHIVVGKWAIYPETAGWDLLLVHEQGFQLGLEAKLTLNAKVIDQALKRQHAMWDVDGPDFRGVLVPQVGRQHHLGEICAAVGIGIITLHDESNGRRCGMNLPMDYAQDRRWHDWLPATRCPVPDYMPDVQAGKPSPVALTDWKIRAIKLMIVLDRKGWVDRADMRALKISPSRWTDAYQGFLRGSGSGQYVRSDRTPDLKAQHPINYDEIAADAHEWGKCFDPFGQEAPGWLLERREPA